MVGKVTFIREGREGRVRYSEGLSRDIEGYFEFGGHDVLAIVAFDTEAIWRKAYPWAVGRRVEILNFIAAELVRTEAPGTIPEINESSGVILLRQKPGAAPPPRSQARPKAAAFFWRLNRLKSAMAIAVLAATLVLGGVAVLGQTMMTRGQPPGAPLNESLRYENDIATLMTRPDPQGPRWSGRGGGETVSVSLLTVPFDGAPRITMLVRNVAQNNMSLARVLGSDGVTLWADAGALYGVRLRDDALVTAADLRRANATLDARIWDDQRAMAVSNGRLHVIANGAAYDVDPQSLRAQETTPRRAAARMSPPEQAEFMAAGFITTHGDWLGVLTPEDRASAYRAGRFLRAIEDATPANTSRFLTHARLDPSADGKRYRIREIAPVSETPFVNAGFLRVDGAAEPAPLQAPSGALIIHTKPPVLSGVLLVTRVDEDGRVIWTADTGLDRFTLRQILAGDGVSAFIGARPPQPGKLSEPLLVFVAHDTGAVRVESLWR